jgi:predicted nucleic acid-binding protein
MRFWDSSAVVPLLIDETMSAGVLVEFRRDPEMAVWWLTEVECVSALSRHERDGDLNVDAMVDAMGRLDDLGAAWREIQPVNRVRQVANRLLRVHPLRGADALQLAAAIIAAEEEPATLDLVTLDQRLAAAATREGFRVIRPA